MRRLSFTVPPRLVRGVETPPHRSGQRACPGHGMDETVGWPAGLRRDERIRCERAVAQSQRTHQAGDSSFLGIEVGYDTRRVFLRMKSIRMNCPNVIVFVKYALPRQMAETFFTNSTRLRSRASMNVLIKIPERRHSATSR